MNKTPLKRPGTKIPPGNADRAIELRLLSSEVVRQAAELEHLRANVETLRKTVTQSHDDLLDALYDVESKQLIASSDEIRARYFAMVRRLQKTVHQTTPREATVVVVSKGDGQLAKLYGRKTWDFPQNDQGNYAGYYPESRAEAIALIEAVREKGGAYLVFPATAYWWLDHYSLRQYLERRYRLVHRSEDTCTIFALCETSPWLPLADLVSEFKRRHRRCPAILNWDTGTELAAIFSECAVFAPLSPNDDTLPYLAGSIDLVAVRSEATNRSIEAHRVASEAVLVVSEGPTVTIETQAKLVTRSSRKPRPPSPNGVLRKKRSAGALGKSI